MLPLDLLALTVDSVFVNGTNASYQYNDTLLRVNFPSQMNTGDSAIVNVHYHGSPVKDPTGWGGFYFQGQHAYNLGVGFQSKPHNYGRAWFPCFDNFVERSTYDFHIRTDTSRKAFCNGVLQNTTHHGDGTVTWHWRLSQTIPTYLTSMAVAPYATIAWQYTSKNGQQIPVKLGALPTDTSDVISSFVHLPDAFDAFEKGYGPFRWDRAGFVFVPFNSGAMEHATNIAYPSAAANGSLSQESLMAHEFSHNWWGNLVTCQDAKDMWINEGWASYSEALFFEHVYGQKRYKNFVRTNHKNVLQYAHIRDNGYRAIHGIPHEYTYGSHVYDKGADVAHTMRGYLPDSVFFNCLTSLMADFAYSNLSSEEFRDFMTNCSGHDFNDFFNNWVFSKGFPHFQIEKVKLTSTGNNNYQVDIEIRQRLKQAPDYYSEVPLSITFFDESQNRHTETVYMSGQCGIYTTTLPFDPVYTALDLKEKISDATTDVLKELDSTGTYNFDATFAELEVQQINTPAKMRIVHNWVGAEAFSSNRPGLHLSTERYWTIEGIVPDDLKAKATFKYNGQTSQNGGYLDNDVLTNSEDSLIIMHRPSPQGTWNRADSFEVRSGFSSNDKRGEIDVFDAKTGEYALAIYNASQPDTFSTSSPDTCRELTTSSLDGRSQAPGFQMYPNPANQQVTITFETPPENSQQIGVFDRTGNLITTKTTDPNTTNCQLNTSHWANGVYFIKLLNGAPADSRKLVVLDHR